MSNKKTHNIPSPLNTQDTFHSDALAPIKHSLDDVRQQQSKVTTNKNKLIPILFSSVFIGIIIIGAAAYYYNSINDDAVVIQETQHETIIEDNPPFDPQQERIKRLLNQAEDFKLQGQFIQPIGKNAFGKFESVLRIDNNNEKALSGIQSIADHFIQVALNHIDKGQLEAAELAIQQAKTVSADSDGIADIEQTLAALISSSDASAVEKIRRDAAKKAEQEKAWREQQAKKKAVAEEAEKIARQQAAERAAMEKLADEARLREEAEANAAQQRLAKLKIQGLLNKADTYFKRQEFYAPEEENALTKYSLVIAIDPGNRIALQGIDNVIDKMIPIIETQLNNKHFSHAKNLFDLAETANPYHPKILLLKKKQNW